jgi:hypothetical protein
MLITIRVRNIRVTPATPDNSGTREITDPAIMEITDPGTMETPDTLATLSTTITGQLAAIVMVTEFPIATIAIAMVMA